METPVIATPDNQVIQTILYQGISYLISQVRICRKCKKTLVVTDGNHRLYFNKLDRIALHEHIQCPEQGFFGHTRTEYSPQEKQEFLYPNRKS